MPRNSILYAPVALTGSFISFFAAKLRPLAPHFTPLIICCFLLPVLVLLSLFAGFLVWQNVAVGWDASLFFQYGDGAQPYARVVLPPLHTRQRYDISLHLAVPASESNLELGNFMSSLVLYTPGNYTLASVRRPAMVNIPSTSFFRSKPSRISIDIPLLSGFIPGISYVEAEVSVGRQDGWTGLGNGQPRELTVYSASLKGRVAHHGIRGLVTRFPFFSSIAASVIFLSILTAIVGACLLPSVLAGISDEEETRPALPAPETEKEISYKEESASETELKPRRRSSKGKSRPKSEGSASSQKRRRSRSEIKNESDVEPVIIPSASETETPLRRRASRLSASMRQHSPDDSS